MSARSVASPVGSVEPVRRSPVGLVVSRIATMCLVELQKLRHDRTELITRGIQPALWLLVFGETFTRLRAIPTGGVPYLDYLAPGILAQSALFIAIFYGIQIIWERDAGVLAKLLVTPTPRVAMVTGKAFAAGVRALVQALVVLVLAALLGVALTANPLRLLGMAVTVVLGSAFFCCLSITIAGLVLSRDRLMGIGQAITMPLFFASNALYPVDLMPGWLQWINRFNPLGYEVDALRGLLLLFGLLDGGAHLQHALPVVRAAGGPVPAEHVAVGGHRGDLRVLLHQRAGRLQLVDHGHPLQRPGDRAAQLVRGLHQVHRPARRTAQLRPRRPIDVHSGPDEDPGAARVVGAQQFQRGDGVVDTPDRDRVGDRAERRHGVRREAEPDEPGADRLGPPGDRSPREDVQHSPAVPASCVCRDWIRCSSQISPSDRDRAHPAARRGEARHTAVNAPTGNAGSCDRVAPKRNCFHLVPQEGA